MAYLLFGSTQGLEVADKQSLPLVQRLLQLRKRTANLGHRVVLALHQLLADLGHQADGCSQLGQPVRSQPISPGPPLPPAQQHCHAGTPATTTPSHTGS